MAFEIIITPYAEVDLKDALMYYTEVSESIRQAFLANLKTKLKSIQQKSITVSVGYRQNKEGSNKKISI